MVTHMAVDSNARASCYAVARSCGPDKASPNTTGLLQLGDDLFLKLWRKLPSPAVSNYAL